MTTLEAKSLKLKEVVAQFDPQLFLGDMMGMMRTIPSYDFTDKSSDLYGLSSPMRQLFYLAGLNMTSSPGQVTKSNFADEEWADIKRMLGEIEREYFDLFASAAEGKEASEDLTKIGLVASAFFNYFNQGHLNYEEQVLERIESCFKPFANEIEAQFGVTPDDFILFYNELGEIFHAKLNGFMAPGKQGKETWEEFGSRMTKEGIHPSLWQAHMPEHIAQFFSFLHDHTEVYTFKKEDIKSLPVAKTQKFLSAFAFERTESDFLYYSQSNPLYERTIAVFGDDYVMFEHKQLGHAFYSTVSNFLAKDKKLGEQFLKRRGDALEIKIEKVFADFFGESIKIYHSYYNELGNEQDTLVLVNDTAFIIEAKSSKRKEPLRNPDKAFPMLKNNFDEVIQKGYDQAYRIKKYFSNKIPLPIHNKKGALIETIDTTLYKNIFSVVVTLEKFGQLQTDLVDMLTMFDDDPTYPWSVSIDDLEVLFLSLKKLKVSDKKFINYLHLRERMQGYLLCGDELQVFGWLLTQKKVENMVTRLEKTDKPLLTTPEMADLYDKLYDKGLGFENERQVARKQSGQFISF